MLLFFKRMWKQSSTIEADSASVLWENIKASKNNIQIFSGNSSVMIEEEWKVKGRGFLWCLCSVFGFRTWNSNLGCGKKRAKESASRSPVAPLAQTPYLCCRQSRRSRTTRRGTRTPSWGSSADGPPSLLRWKGKMVNKKKQKNNQKWIKAPSWKGSSEGLLRVCVSVGEGGVPPAQPLIHGGFRWVWVAPSTPTPTCCAAGVSGRGPSVSVGAAQWQLLKREPRRDGGRSGGLAPRAV